MTKEFLQSIKVIVLGLVLAFGINYAMAWSEPGCAPTGCNADAPITVGPSQWKEGGLSIGKKTNPAKADIWQFYNPNVIPKLDVEGDTNVAGTLSVKNVITSAAGLIVKGGTILAPVSENSTSDGQLFSVLDHSYYVTDPVFAVDTRSVDGFLPGISTKGFTASENGIFNKNAEVIEDFSVGDTATVGNRLTVNGLATVTTGLAIGKANPNDFAYPLKYNLDLTGTTNIGQGGSCWLNKYDSDTKGCPVGSYLQRINTADTSSYAKCVSFNPDEKISNSSGFCNTYVDLVAYFTAFAPINSSDPCGSDLTATVAVSKSNGNVTRKWFAMKNGTIDNSLLASSCFYKDNASCYASFGSVKKAGITAVLGVEITDEANKKVLLSGSKKFAHRRSCS